jgi:hypothetical protein
VAAQFTGVKSGDHSDLHYISQREPLAPRNHRPGLFLAAPLTVSPSRLNRDSALTYFEERS